MKIAIISREYPPETHIGGIATYSRIAAELLARHGHEVHVLCNGKIGSRKIQAGVEVHRIPMGPHALPQGRFWYRFRSLYRRYLPVYLETRTWATTLLEYVTTQFDLSGFDALEYPETHAEGLLVAQRLSGLRKICRIHSSWLDEYPANFLEARLLLRWQKSGCEAADRVVSPSRYMIGNYAKNRLGFSGTVEYSPNPLQFWKQPIDWNSKAVNHLLFVGRVEHRKGLHILLKALESAPAQAGLVLRIIGAPAPGDTEPDRRCLESFRRAESQGIPGVRMEYLGAIPHEDLPRHYDWAGIVVMPTLMDNYPYVALEALSRGCHVLGSRVGGMPEIISESGAGGLFEPENSAQLAQKIGECQESGERILSEAKEHAERFHARYSEVIAYRRLLSLFGGQSDPHNLPGGEKRN